MNGVQYLQAFVGLTALESSRKHNDHGDRNVFKQLCQIQRALVRSKRNLCVILTCLQCILIKGNAWPELVLKLRKALFSGILIQMDIFPIIPSSIT